jgi:hypothetical protein
MTRSLLIVGLVVSLVGSGFAASSTPVEYTLTFHKPDQVVGPGAMPVVQVLQVTGVIGGVAVIGEYADDAWSVGPKAAPDSTLAGGAFSCSGTHCTFSITTLLDEPAGIRGPSFQLGRAVSGPLPGFATRREWVSAVAHWAESHIGPGLRNTIVSQAAGVRAGNGQ